MSREEQIQSDQPPESGTFDLATADPRTINRILSALCVSRCPDPRTARVVPSVGPLPHAGIDQVIARLAAEDGCYRLGQVNRTIKLTLISGADLDAIPEALFDNRVRLSGDRLGRSPLLPQLARNVAAAPLCNIILSVRRHFRAFGVLEHPYIDLDFLHGHAGFYDLGFPIHPISCARLHFFSGNEALFDELVYECELGTNNAALKAKLDLEYCGYCVLRPTASYVVGRTAVRFDVRPVDEWSGVIPAMEAEKGGIPCLTAWEEHAAHLLNTRLTVQSPAFIQQDPNLGRCATASLWVATHLMAAKCGTHRFHYGTITRQAVGGGDSLHDTSVLYDPSDPEDGLTPFEIRRAFAETGANSFASAPFPDATAVESYLKVTQDVYSFVESGYPVLFFLGSETDGVAGHVVVAVGHLMPRITRLKEMLPVKPLMARFGCSCSDRHFMVGNATRLYYVNDDAYGPYNRIEFGVPEEGLLAKVSKKGKEMRLHRGRRKEAFCLKAVVTPIPAIVRTRSTEPLAELLRYFDWRYAGMHKSCFFIWRSVLVEGPTFKLSVCSRQYSNRLREWYASVHLPRYVWLFEVSIVSEEQVGECFDPRSRRQVDGEFLFDATTSSHDIRLVTERVGGLYRDYRFVESCLFSDDEAGLYECFDLKLNEENWKLRRSDDEAQG